LGGERASTLQGSGDAPRARLGELLVREPSW